VIVYIDIRPDMADSLGGSMRFLARSATNRFVRVNVNRHFQTPMQVALLGHELQHAVEVASAMDVNSASDLHRLYARLGVAIGQNAFDSVAARQAGYRVRDELSKSRSEDRRMARAGARPAIDELTVATDHASEIGDEARP
jgi:hypothetical protein